MTKALDLQLVLNSVRNGMMIVDRAGKIAFCNARVEELFGVREERASGGFVRDILPELSEKLDEALRTGKPVRGYPLKGRTASILTNMDPIRSDGQTVGVLVIFQDVSEIKEIVEELDAYKETTKMLDAIIESSYDGLWICDREGKILRINKASERLNGVKAEDVVGKNMRDLVAQGFVDQSVTLEVIKRRSTFTMIQKVNWCNKKLLVTGNPIFDSNGNLAFVVTNDRDIDELNLLQEQLEESRALSKRYYDELLNLQMRELKLNNIVARSDSMNKVVDTAIKISNVDTNVLVLGESGVGKGLIAKLIHESSERSQRPFIQVNCASIPPTLMESELFGYEKGAFTGASSQGKPGFFELAHHGTLFLDEVAEIPPNLQVKLLKFLEDNEIVRVGGLQPLKLDIRVIAATNRDIEELVKTGRFREDLYFRLNVVPIHIPPLRERVEDIPPLILFFLDRFNKKFKTNKQVLPDVIEVLTRYSFPGNIRELANLIERLVVLTEGPKIKIGDLPQSILNRVSPPLEQIDLTEDLTLKEGVARVEKAMISSALKRYGSQNRAARKLGVNQTTIGRKMRKYHLDAPALSAV